MLCDVVTSAFATGAQQVLKDCAGIEAQCAPYLTMKKDLLQFNSQIRNLISGIEITASCVALPPPAVSDLF